MIIRKKTIFVLIVMLLALLLMSCESKTELSKVDKVNIESHTDTCEFLVKTDSEEEIALLQQIVDWSRNDEENLIKIHEITWICDPISASHICKLVKSKFDIYPTIWLEEYSVWGLYDVDNSLFVKKITIEIFGDGTVECKISQ